MGVLRELLHRRVDRRVTASLAIISSLTTLSAQDDSTHSLEDMSVQSSFVETQSITRSEEMGKLEIDADEILKLPSIGEADIARSLKLIPGVSVGNENSAQLIVQGGAPEQNLTLLDRIPIYSVDHFFGFFSPFNGEAIENVTIYKNYFPGQYGSRISSVQAYKGSVADQDIFTAGVRIGLLSGSFNVGIPLGDRFSIFVGGRRSYTDFLQSPLYDQIFSQFDQESDMQYQFNTGGINRTPVFNYADINTKLRYFHNKDTAEVSFYWSEDDLNVDTEIELLRESVNVAQSATSPVYIDSRNDREINNSADWGNLGSSGRWARRWNDLLKTELLAGYSRYYLNSSEYQRRSKHYMWEGAFQEVYRKELNRSNDNRVDELFGEVSSELWFSDWNQMTLGFHGQLYTTEFIQSEMFAYSTNLNPTSVLNPNSTLIITDNPYLINDTITVTDKKVSEGVGSAWIQDNINIGDKFFASLAARVSYYQGTHNAYFSPRLSMAFDPIPQLRLKLGGGRYYQFINRAEMEDTYLEGERYFWILSGNDAAPVASSDQFSVGFSLTPWDFIFDVEAYIKRQNDISTYKRSFSSEVNSFITGKGSSAGIDFMLQKSVGIYSGWAAYTLSEAVVQYGKEVNRGRAFYSPYDRTHELKLVNTVEIGGFNASLTWMYATGTPYSEPVGHDSIKVFNRNYFNVKQAVWGPKNTQRLPDYHRMDISLSYKFQPSDRFDITLGGSVFNLYNNTNVRGYDYKYIIDENGITGYDDKVVRLESHYMGITPSLFVACDFRKWRD